MDFTGPYRYTINIEDVNQERFIKRKVHNEVATNFKRPVTLKRTPKIYILKYNSKIVYVGYASQSIGTRLGQGIRAKGLNGYHGYKWKHVSEIELIIFVFDKELKEKKHIDDKPFIDFAEAVEAELVFKIRQETGKWPEFQNEIHFNNIKLEKATEIASQMYTKIIK